jgi:hypothetical protein
VGHFSAGDDNAKQYQTIVITGRNFGDNQLLGKWLFLARALG